jgi:hypothetical protein
LNTSGKFQVSPCKGQITRVTLCFRKEILQSDIRNSLEDGKLFLACQLMKENKNEEAIQAFNALKSPYATFYQAMVSL